jgi:glycosyltransferase involved in cell wall biosynthesis
MLYECENSCIVVLLGVFYFMLIVNNTETILLLKSGMKWDPLQEKEVEDKEVDKEVLASIDKGLLGIREKKGKEERSNAHAGKDDDYETNPLIEETPPMEFVTNDHNPHGTVYGKDPYVHYHSGGQMAVEWTGPSTDLGGYANMNRSMMFRLDQMPNVNLRYEFMPSLNDLDSSTFDRLLKMSRKDVSQKCPKIWGMTVPQMSPADRYNIYYTMMETVGVHKIYAERCDLCSELWLPTQFCIDQFKNSGVRTRITKMPLGVDHHLYDPMTARKIEFSVPLKKFVFLSIFGWSYRKGYDVLIRSFCEEFCGKDDVTLLISSRFYGSIDEGKKERIRKDAREVISQVGNPDPPHIVLFGDLMPIDLMPSMYKLADCFILISRGEGFGLPYAEASLMGLPVIGSNVTGQTEFLNHDNSLLVEADGYEVADRRMSWISHFYEGQKFPEFREPAIKTTRQHMRYVYENYDEAKARNDVLKRLILSEYTWDKAAERAYNRLKEIYDGKKGA